MSGRRGKLNAMVHTVGVKAVIITLVVLLVSVATAIYVGKRVYGSNKKVLLLQGELLVKESTLEYVRYLQKHENTIELVGNTLNNLLAEGASSDAIEKYLIDETRFILEKYGDETTGLYGLFNDLYIDGAGWVPDSSYVPKQRPWYWQTLTSSGHEVVFIKPYSDANTGTMMMTVSKLLDDNTSVVAMDVSLDPMQEILEKVSGTTEGSLAMVLSRDGTVIAHSDISQVDRNYLYLTGTTGYAVAHEILDNGQHQFDIETGEGNYSVYVDSLDGGWYGVSMINSDIWYGPLKRTVAIFIVILTVMVLLIIGAFLRLSGKNVKLQILNNRIYQEEKRRNALQALSETDRMTGLNDRVSGKRKVEEVLSAGHGGAFLEIDIDHFKMINDTYGHQTGDAVIMELTNVLRNMFRNNDITIRLGGDEFGVFAVGITTRDLCRTVVGRLFSRLEQVTIPQLDGGKVVISVGAAICQEHGQASFDSLYAKADGALYISKKAEGNCLTFSES